nr:unnamed protein product [Callosobruchus chinensis]
MTNDNYTHRKKVLSKFHNRPPFTLKMKEPSVAKSKSVEPVPRKKIRNKYLSLETSYQEVISQLESRGKQLEKDATREIIPRVIQSFQRVTPSKETYLRCRKKSLASNNTSLHTLFRSNNMPLGKHIPDHKIMKHLLQNLAEDSVEAKYFDEFADTVPIKEMNTDINVIVKNNGIRIDKSTSTTGLIWLIPEDPVLGPKTRIPRRQRSNQVMPNCHRTNQNVSDKLRPNQSLIETRQTGVKERSRYAYETVPTKEPPPNCVSKSQHQNCKEIIANESNQNNRPRSNLQREKSFVKAQVEKFNRINDRSTPNRKLPSQRCSAPPRKIQSCACPYMGLMNRAKKSFPKYDSYESSTDNNQEWSDNNVTLMNSPTKITFPKETRMAVESMLDKTKPSRIPLAKFVQPDNSQLRPAIELGDGEGFKTPYHNIAIPCTRNLLCDRGYHEGPCDKTDIGECLHRYNADVNRPFTPYF